MNFARRRVSMGCLATATLLFLLADDDSHAHQESSVVWRDLVRAFGNGRPFEGRLSGGFPHRSVDLSPIEQPPNLLERARIGAEIVRRAEDQPSPDSLHAAGVLNLFLRNPAAATALLKEARELDGGSAAISSDLGVAYLERARAESSPSYLVDALLALDHAAVGDNPSIESLFNRALVLEQLSLISAARDAWSHYRTLERVQSWNEEAAAHLRLLDEDRGASWDLEREELRDAALLGRRSRVEAVIERRRERSRILGEQELLPLWAAASRNGDPDRAERELRIAEEIGKVLEQRYGDGMLMGAVWAIRAAQRETGDRLSLLIEGHATFGRALENYIELQVSTAASLFESARQSLADAESPYEGWASLYLAMCMNLQNRYADTETALEVLLERNQERPYPTLRARAGWILGLARITLGDPVGSLSAYRLSLEEFVSQKETENVASVNALIAQNLDFIGDHAEAWKHRFEALSASGRTDYARSIYLEAAEASAKQGVPAVARYYLDEARHPGAGVASPVFLAETLYRRSSMDALLGEAREAEQDLALAKLHASQIVDPQTRADLEARIRIAEARHLLSNTPDRAVSFYSQTIKSYEKTNYQFLLTDLYFERARALRATGDLSGAESDFDNAVRLVEDQRDDVDSAGYGLAFAKRNRAIFDEVVRFQATARKRPDRALEYYERGRTRMARRAVSSRPFPQPDKALRALDLEAIRSSLPGGLAILEFLVTEEGVLGWVIRKESVNLAHLDVLPSELRRVASRFRALLEEGDGSPELDRLSSILYSWLLQPLLIEMPEGADLVIVPDGVLAEIPFAALREPETGRYVIQDRSVSVSPSASFFVQSRRRRMAMDARSLSSILVLTDPEFDQGMFPRLPRFPLAKAAGARIRQLYPSSEAYGGADVTRARFVERAGYHDVVHFAGHAVSTSESPTSRLLLAPGAEDTGVLYAHELLGLRFERTRLVVLAACTSASSWPAQPVDTTSLAHGFLAAGVPTVVASLWSVDEAATAALFETFHRWLERTGDASQSLRQAQLELIESDVRERRFPSRWAPFVVLGGS
jgi:CHAT domain-containing protein